MKTLKGGYVSVSPNGDHILTVGGRVYVYDAHTLSSAGIFKPTSSYVTCVAMSHDGKLIAVKNTSGRIAIIEYPTGNILGVCKMERREGFKSMCFSKDDSYIFDFDHAGNIMKLNISDFKYEVLYRFNKYMFGIYYDEYADKICAIDTRNSGCVNGCIWTSPVEPFSFCESGKVIIDNYGYNSDYCFNRKFTVIKISDEFFIFDKDFKLKIRVKPTYIYPNGEEVELSNMRGIPGIRGMTLSENGEMLFISYGYTFCLFEFPAMKQIICDNCNSFDSAKFINSDTQIVISTDGSSVVCGIEELTEQKHFCILR